jgi:hypothetical protein
LVGAVLVRSVISTEKSGTECVYSTAVVRWSLRRRPC